MIFKSIRGVFKSFEQLLMTLENLPSKQSTILVGVDGCGGSGNLEFMELVRKEHPYWDNLKFPSEYEMKEVFYQAISSPNDIKVFIIEQDNNIMGYVNTWCVKSYNKVREK